MRHIKRSGFIMCLQHNALKKFFKVTFHPAVLNGIANACVKILKLHYHNLLQLPLGPLRLFLLKFQWIIYELMK